MNKNNFLVITAWKDVSTEVSTLNIFSSSSNFTSSIIVTNAMVLGFNYSHTQSKEESQRIGFLHSTNFSTIHHVVRMPCIKRPQEIQKRFDHLYNIKSHSFVQKQDFNFKRLKKFRQVIKLQQLSLHVHSQCDNYCQNIWRQLGALGLI